VVNPDCKSYVALAQALAHHLYVFTALYKQGCMGMSAVFERRRGLKKLKRGRKIAIGNAGRFADMDIVTPGPWVKCRVTWPLLPIKARWLG